ncbi:hypothetical protein TRP66_03140 [Pseudomonas sp. JDS28PS106]|uniref:hypothetical protein n=1 Tax=Pseudomonas sp. JDS28PS106 TaxID=2497235 RepID=UPI002FD79A9B
MPTGYTHDIKDGISFKAFALNCARAFGACITLRDEPGGGEKIPEEFQPSDYHFKALAEARSTLATLESMTSMECGFKAAEQHDQGERLRLDRLKELADLKQRYEEMLDCARLWSPPTADHAGLKEFMIKQISESIDWDCDTTYYSRPTERLSASEWLECAKSKAMKDIEYHKEHWAAELQRTADRNAWVNALRESL